MNKAKAGAKPRNGWTRAARPTPEGDIPRDADGWPTQSAKERTIPLFSPEVLTPSPEELRRAETNRKAEASARRKIAKAKRERGENFDDEQIRKFNERTGL
jgi:hypothetical protein